MSGIVDTQTAKRDWSLCQNCGEESKVGDGMLATPKNMCWPEVLKQDARTRRRGWFSLNTRDAVISFLVQEVSAISGLPLGKLSETTPLIGSGTVLNSRGLVELLVALEEFSEEKLQVHFDWTSDSAMSTNRSVYRTVASLADYIASIKPS